MPACLPAYLLSCSLGLAHLLDPAGLLALLACSLVCLLACLPACLLACLLAFLLARSLACLLACLLACTVACLLACLFARLLPLPAFSACPAPKVFSQCHDCSEDPPCGAKRLAGEVLHLLANRAEAGCKAKGAADWRSQHVSR